MQCPMKICQSYFMKYNLAIITLLLIIFIWLFKLNQAWFYKINSMHSILPIQIWEALNFISYTKFAILPIILLSLSFFFCKNKLINVILLIVIFYAFFYGLKILIAEPRPYIVLPSDSFFWLNQFEDSNKSAYKSFPSGHTGNAAVFVFSLIQLFFAKAPFIKILLFIFLLLVGLSRICTGWHWPIDVLASGLIGYILVKICLSLELNKLKSSL